MLKYGKFPYGLGNHITFEVHPPMEITENTEELIAQVEQIITKNITSIK